MLIAHSTEPQNVTVRRCSKWTSFEYSMQSSHSRVTGVGEWIATPEADITFGGSAGNSHVVSVTYRMHYCLFHYCIISKNSHQYTSLDEAY